MGIKELLRVGTAVDVVDVCAITYCPVTLKLAQEYEDRGRVTEKLNNFVLHTKIVTH